ncbi:MAG: lipoprotein signal peptidase [Thermoleophilia bacterium]|nr:lipoprotein signal peptidase [Thermoleophilia bacterium]
MGRVLAAAGIATGATLVVDQASKAIVRATMEPGERHDIALGGEVALTHVKNTGAAYGLFGELPTWVPMVGTAAIGAGMLALGARSPRSAIVGAGAGLVIGGGLGNVIDRVHQGHVTDFIHTTDLFGHYNVADVAISAGLATAAGALIFAR